jgi:RimJ/RimL family protein N-acetyltransferase
MNYWQGAKIRLRALEPSDAEIFYKWDQNSERARNLDFVWPPTSLAFARAWIEEQSKKRLENDTYHWVIEDRNGAPVGSISTHDCDRRRGTFSYGIDIAPEHQRKGYASEAIRLILKWYFEELGYQKANVSIVSYNTASINLHEKLGFQREGTLRRMTFSRGEYFDLVWLGMTMEEFQSARQKDLPR